MGVLLVESNTDFNAANCADSAGYYVAAHASMKQRMDGGIAVDDGVAVSRCVNGNVAVQNINGLDGRLQAILCIRDVLLDLPAETASETLNFTWRRNSALEDTGRVGSNGRPIRAYIPREWTLEVSLAKQRP